MADEKSLAHSVWDCRYHIVWIPKYRKKRLYGEFRKYPGETLDELARQRESRILEGHLCVDHIHVLMEIPPKYSVDLSGWVYQRKKRDSDSRKLYGQKTAFHRAEFPGEGVLRVNGWTERIKHQKV